MTQFHLNPEMLVLAREYRGLTQSRLAVKSNIRQWNVSRYESGLAEISDDHIKQIAQSLNFPLPFFSQSGTRAGLLSGCIYHRKRSTMPLKKLKILEAQLDLIYTNIQRFEDSVNLPDVNFPRFDLEDYDGDADIIANKVRQFWNLPSGPIKNLVKVIEDNGAIVKLHSFGTRKLDAFSKWHPKRPPLIFINSEIPGDRLRFSLAHEIGHLIMHRIPTETAEKDADRFAAELLLPANDIKTSLSPLSWKKLSHLKNYWKVSIAALIKRAYDLKRINKRQYESKFQYLSRMGYRKNEPIYIPLEQPIVLAEIFHVHIKQMGFNLEQLCDLLLINVDDLKICYHTELSKILPESFFKVVSDN